MKSVGKDPKRFARALVGAWFMLVGLAVIVVMLVALVPNELQEHVGVAPFAVPFVLVVALVGLPLLVVAVRLTRRRSS